MFLSQALGVYLAGKLVAVTGYAVIFLIAGAGLLGLALWFSRRIEAKR